MVYNDPNTKKAIGVLCDICGKLYKNNFQYYSVKMDLIAVDSEKQQTGPVNIDKRNLDLDLCVDCVEDLKKRVIKTSVIIAERKESQWNTSTSQPPSPLHPTTGLK